MKQGNGNMLTLIFPLLCYLLLLGAAAKSSLPDKKLLKLHNFQWNQKSSNPNCFSDKSSGDKDSITLEMKHHDFCSNKNIDWNKILQERVIMDSYQVQLLQSRIKKQVSGEFQSLSDTQVPLGSGTRLEILNYVVTMQLGARNFTVIVDTGSDLTWVQCKPCKSCYNQQEPIFDPSDSLSYRQVSCNSSACRSLQESSGDHRSCSFSPSTCGYYVSYGDGSYTRGELGTERLHLGDTEVNDFVFGCGKSNKGLFGEVSGLMGLGKSDFSLISQTSDLFGGVFSYCLPSTDAGDSGSLSLGWNPLNYKNTTPISYTKFVTNPQLSSFYTLNLTGMTVGGSHLEASTFGQKGILIDSGTVITRLPPSIYEALRAAFLQQFTGYPLAPRFSILDTCFDLSSYKNINLPTVRMLFEGNAELNVDVNGVFYYVKADASQVCLAFASLAYEDEIAIIGNYQQKNQRVIYDTKQSYVGFAEEECAFT